MKFSICRATIVAFLAAFGVINCLELCQAQEQGGLQGNSPTNSGDRIAVIDINYIFKNHFRFKAMVEDWKKDVKMAEDQMKQKRKEIDSLIKDLENYKRGSPDYKTREKQIAQMQAALQAEMQLQKKDLMQHEAKMYLTVYKEVQEQISYFSRQHGITLVLRFNRASINEEDPRQIQQGLLRPVLFQDNIDITMDILKRLNPPPGRIGKRQQNQVPVARPR